MLMLMVMVMVMLFVNFQLDPLQCDRLALKELLEEALQELQQIKSKGARKSASVLQGKRYVDRIRQLFKRNSDIINDNKNKNSTDNIKNNAIRGDGPLAGPGVGGTRFEVLAPDTAAFTRAMKIKTTYMQH